MESTSAGPVLELGGVGSARRSGNVATEQRPRRPTDPCAPAGERRARCTRTVTVRRRRHTARCVDRDAAGTTQRWSDSHGFGDRTRGTGLLPRYRAVDVFALGLGVLPVLGWVPLENSVIDNLSHLVLPATALAAGAASIAVRQTRAAMIETLSSDYVRTARAMGIDERKIVWRYALRNIVPTIVTVYGLLAVAMLGATVILEQIFVLPGLGSALVIAIDTRDYPMLQGIVLLFVVIVLLVNILVDVVNNMISPQLRKGTIS
ncbi:hypothetical protein CBI33_21085 [Rhodococcus erythropolis]|nr:hypothetical protein CBI33_21085 [Rhodococcus erythropolis]